MNKVAAGLQFLGTLQDWKGRGKFSLAPSRSILRRLGDPQNSIPMIHVAGTNGKGSVSAAIASILGAGGYRVGLNISPHLTSVRERICIDGYPINNDAFGEYLYDVKASSEREGVLLSMHEVLTITSFLAFRELGVGWGVVEVGLGGRLDCSNVIESPAASVIVSIDFDHQEILGQTIEEIAREKAGIVKQGRPVFIGSLPRSAQRVVAGVCDRLMCPLYALGADFSIDMDVVGGVELPKFVPGRFDLGNSALEFSASLRGNHQIHNMAVAIATGRFLGLSDESIVMGLKQLFWPGRLESVAFSDRSFLLDCAHNPAGVRSFMSFLDSTGVQDIDLTIGMLRDKEWAAMVELLAPRVGTWRLLEPQSSRAVDNSVLFEVIQKHVSGNEVRILRYGPDYETYLKHVILDCEQTVYVAGSMHLVGPLRGMLVSDEKPIWQRRMG